MDWKWLYTWGPHGKPGLVCCTTGENSVPGHYWPPFPTPSSFLLILNLLSRPLQCCVFCPKLPPPPSSNAFGWRLFGALLDLTFAFLPSGSGHSLPLGVLGMNDHLLPLWSPSLPLGGYLGRPLSSSWPASGPWSPLWVGSCCCWFEEFGRLILTYQ